MKAYAMAWFWSAVGIAGFSFVIGAWVRQHPFGIFVDLRNRMSLSRFQIVLWTIVIVSAFFAIALTERTLDIFIPPEIWALMAISTGSTAGAVIIKGTKSEKEPTAEAETKVAARATVNVQMNARAAAKAAAAAQAAKALTATTLPTRLGVLAVADKPRFADMFKGEEITDKDFVDISKVQMFFFTIAAIVGYGFVLWSADLADATGAEAGYKVYFPMLSTSLVTLIGISHAGYLTVKAAPHTPTQ